MYFKTILDDTQHILIALIIRYLTLFDHTHRELFISVSHYGKFSDGDIEISLIGVKRAQSKSVAGNT
jgi:hypothetical protein